MIFKNILSFTIFIFLQFTCIPLSLASKKLRPGDIAPAFSLQGDDGTTYTLSDFKDQKLVLYFYPLDDSYYCTQQACNIAGQDARFKKNRITVFGINHESIKSHAAFKKKHHLPFTLLSDPSCATIKAYDAYSRLFIKRITYLIDKGKIVAILRDIDVNNHADQIIKAFHIG